MCVYDRVHTLPSVWKLNAWLAAMLSGGSLESWSVTCAAMTVTVQVSSWLKSESGFKVKVVGPPETVAECAPLAPQLIVNQVPVTLTGSENVSVMSLPTGTPVAESAGDVTEICGAAS